MRPIDADAFVERYRKLYCEDCDRRKGMKNGKMKFVYPIGGAPCRACEVDDMLDAVDDAPTITTEKLTGMKDKLIERICANCDTPPETRLRLCGECPIISPIREAFNSWNS